MGTISADSNGDSLNATAIWILINQLSPSNRNKVLAAAGIDEQTLETILQRGKMHVKSYERPMMQYTEYRISKILLLYVPPILIILGTFGNLFSFIILRRRPMLKVSTYFYLASLAIADSLVLYIGLLRIWINELTGIDAMDLTNWLCKLTCVFGYFSSDFSVWLIIAVTVERFIVVCFPFKANGMCNVSRARKVIVLLIVIMFSINLHFLFTVELVTTPVDGKNIVNCEAAAPFPVLVDQAWPWVDAIIYSFVPFVTITVLNILIIRQVLKAHGSRERLQNFGDRRVLETRRQMSEVTSKLTAMLLTVSFTFLLTTLPMNITLIVTYFWNKEDRELENTAKFHLVKTITELLMYVNHSMNFFLYCATGRKFRQQVLKLVCHKQALQTWSSICDDQPKHQSKKDLLLNHMNCHSEHLHTESEYMKTKL
ncbi:hypothetical protein SNE40_008530 [Patella caerulea]|uniref:G-protein coupled receptors family 1 profile domain-containing protein n=1 Tax=Patella caerulea TaxID=87958 RepID=A0AAN8JZW1_PATCE